MFRACTGTVLVVETDLPFLSGIAIPMIPAASEVSFLLSVRQEFVPVGFTKKESTIVHHSSSMSDV
jgi:hypothetical protein